MPVRPRSAPLPTDGLGLDGDFANELISGVQIDGVTKPKGNDYVVVYRTRRDKRVRPEHAALDGMEWDLDKAHQAPKPPLGYGCRCRLEIVKRGSGNAPETRSEAAAGFKNLQASLDRYGNAEVAELYRAGSLTAADLYQPNGALINRFQARAIAAAKELGEAPAAGLRAIARLKAQGIAGLALDRILADAATRIAGGTERTKAIRAAILAEPQRGLVTASTVDRAVDAITEARLIPPIVTKKPSLPSIKEDEPPPPVPTAKQSDQRGREGQPLRKPSVASPFGKSAEAPDSAAYLVDAERQIARRTTERLLAYDQRGNLIASSEGGVDFADVPRDLPRNVIITHNHPSAQKYGTDSPRAWGTSLSGADVIVAAQYDAAAIRAVSPSGTVFEMRRPPTGWPPAQIIRQAIRAIERRVLEEGADDILAGRISIEVAETLHWHKVQRILADQINATYTWGAHE